jgi:hypothetical protein
MGYAFEGVPWHELPDSEKLGLWRQEALVRDSFLNREEFFVRHQVLWDLGMRGAQLDPGGWKKV